MPGATFFLILVQEEMFLPVFVVELEKRPVIAVIAIASARLKSMT